VRLKTSSLFNSYRRSGLTRAKHNLEALDQLDLEVTDGPSCYNGAATTGLQINRYILLLKISWNRLIRINTRHQSFADYFKSYRRYHSLQPQKKKTSSATIKTQYMFFSDQREDSDMSFDETYISMGSAQIRFRRTLRVPDDTRIYNLPTVRIQVLFFHLILMTSSQNLGTFPLEHASNFARTLPPNIKDRRGLLMVHFIFLSQVYEQLTWFTKANVSA
jgi:hypothetical protein